MRELFDSIGTISSTSPDQFTSVAGSYYSRAVGPYVGPDVSPGWSADNHDQIGVIGTFSISTSTGLTAQTAGVAGVWVRYKSFNNTGISIPLDLRTLTGGGHSSVQFTVATSGALSAVVYQGSTSVGPTLNLDTWYYMAVAWVTTGSNTFTFYMYCIPTGSTSNFTPFATQTGINQLSKIQQVNFGSGSSSAWEGRIGAPGLYSISTTTDIVYPPDLNPPVEARHIWAIDPVNGNDNNTGLLGSPWKTVTKFDTESLYSGLMDTTGGYNNGDELIIDTSNSPLQMDAPIEVYTRGLTITSTSSQRWITLQPWITIPNNSFTKTGGYTNIYQTSSTTANAVIWENDIWENHPTGSTFSAVASTLDSTPGSFWTDGTTMYIHPFGNTNPATDSKVYTRSTYFPSYADSGAVILFTPDISVNNIYVRKTATVSPTDNNSGWGYGIQGTVGFGGTSLVANSYSDYCYKHCIGFTDNSSNSNVTILNDEAEQPAPYTGSTNFVSYNGSSTASGNIHTYIGDIVKVGIGIVGSATGGPYQAFTSHNLSGSGQFASINFINDYLPFQSLSFQTGDNIVNISSSTIGSIQYSSILNINDSIFDQQFITGSGTSTVVNSIIAPTSILNTGWLNGVSGNLTLDNNTFDLSGIPSSVPATAPILTKSGQLTFSFDNNAVIIPTGKSYTILGSASSTDGISFLNNAYQFGSSTYVVNNYNDGSLSADRTLSQWQTLGFDIGSFSTTSLNLNNYIPLATSPLIEVGTLYAGLTSTTTDFAGNPIYGIPSIGAYQYQPPYTIGQGLVDPTGSIRVYGDGKYRYITATSSTPSVNLSATPIGGFPTYSASTTRPEWLDISNITWGTSKIWTASSSIATSTVFTVGNLIPNTTYSIYYTHNGPKTLLGSQTSNGSGVLTFTYTNGYSTATFEMDPVSSPVVVTSAATGVSTSTATLNGAITAIGGATTTQSGFVYGTSSSLTTGNATTTLGSQTGTTTLSQSLTGITPNTTYYFEAYAVNSAGTSTGSIQSFATTDTTPPGVFITIPTGGSTVSGSSVSLSANATDDVRVAGVQFVLDGTTPIGSQITSTSSPNTYATTWDSTGISTFGSHTIYAVAEDEAGNFATSSVVINVDNVAPTFVSAVFNSNTQITVTLSKLAATSTITKANAGGFTVTEATTSGPTYAVSSIAPGSDNTKVVLTTADMTSAGATGVVVTYTSGGNGTVADTLGNHLATNSGGIAIPPWNTVAPIISNITSTVPNGAYKTGTPIDIDLTFSKAVNSTGSVTVTLNTGGSCTFTVSSSTVGSCTYTVAGSQNTPALNVLGVSGTIVSVDGNAMTNFTPALNLSANKNIVIDTTAPVPSVIVPSSGATVSGHSVTLTATNSDSGSGIAGVQFFLDGITPIGSSGSTNPYSVTWDSTAVSNASHTLSAVATDVAGNSATSTITVTVNNSVQTYTIGGTLSGLSGTLVLQDNAGDNLSVSSNGSFTFATPLADTSAYSVTVLTQPSGQTCPVSSGAGTVSAANVTSVSVSCITNVISGGGGGGGGGGSPGGGSVSAAELASLLAPTSTTTLTNISGTSIVPGCPIGFICTPNPLINIATPVVTFTRNLTIGSSGKDVQQLQIYLNTHSYRIALSGPGSPGHETTYFGYLTKLALMKFQQAYKQDILTPLGLTEPTGFFGSATMKVVNGIEG